VFDPGSVHVGFVVHKVALGRGFPCQCHSIGAPLLGKMKEINRLIRPRNTNTCATLSGPGPASGPRCPDNLYRLPPTPYPVSSALVACHI
jgi:hypothetical protein